MGCGAVVAAHAHNRQVLTRHLTVFEEEGVTMQLVGLDGIDWSSHLSDAGDGAPRVLSLDFDQAPAADCTAASKNLTS